MLKKALKKLTKVASRRSEKSTSSKETSSHTRLLTAEGWKRLMMKKRRKN